MNDEFKAEINKRMPKGMRDRQYVLDGAGEPIHEPDFWKYIEWWGVNTPLEQPVRVAFDTMGGVEISTVFLMMPHITFAARGKPSFLFFETMVSRSDSDGVKIWPWKTRVEAAKGHAEIVKSYLHVKKGKRS